jgi:polysaccharide pyruvyl transferase WcaK-like protein
VGDYVSFRDLQSQELSRRIGFAGKSEVSSDSVYSLEPSELGVDGPARRDRLTVGIAPLPYCNPRTDPAEKDQQRYDEFIQKMAAFASHLHRRSYALMLFGSDIGVDPLAIEDLQEVLRERHNHIAGQAASVESIEELLRSISNCDYVVTCRYHGVIFAHLLLKPVLALSPHPKVRDLMQDLGLERYCVDIQTCDHGSLIQMFEALVRNSNEIKQQMTRTLAVRKSSLMMEFDELFPREHAGAEQGALSVAGIRRRGFLLRALRGRGEWTIGKVR